eukprot:s2238_g10.t1
MADFVPAVDEVDLPLPPSLPGVAKGGAAENGSTSLSPSPHRDSLCSGRASPSALAYERLDVEEDSRLRAFKQGESLGKGAYGEVFKAMVAGKFMAVKKISLDVSLGQHAVEKEINGLLQEINTLKRLKHKRIVRYQGCIRQDSEEDPALLIFLEYMPSGSIKGVLQKFGPYGIRLVKKYTRQILEGLDFLHTEKIVHRDVKGANILIDAHGDAKLADFGASQNLEALHTLHGTCTTGGVKSIHGSVFWMAPEVMKYRAGRRSDIWSLGCTVIEMITADAPWPNLREHKLPVTEMLRHIVDSDEIPPLPDKIHPDCRSFLERTLNRDHTRRPYADKLLGHRFVVEVTTPAASPGGSAAAASPVSEISRNRVSGSLKGVPKYPLVASFADSSSAPMPQAVAPRRKGIALDFSLTETPTPVYLDTRRNASREHRAAIKDYNNMLINEVRAKNDMHPRHWTGNGFAGHVQYVPYIGTDPLRPGVKFERDMQISTMPMENGKPLNISQMTRSASMVKFVSGVDERERQAHDTAMAANRELRAVASTLHREEDGHNHYRNQVELNQQRQDRIRKVAEALPGMRAAGVASINPRMGTCGSLPDLTTLRGRAGFGDWRTTTPWAHGGDWAPESLSHN